MISEYKARIRRVYQESNLDEVEFGLRWYRLARTECQAISKRRGVSLLKVCAILAALSPRNKWDRNLKDCESIITQGDSAKVATFGNNKRKALKILRLRRDCVNEVMLLLNGRKVQSFFSNVYFDDCDRVTVDVWHSRIVELQGSLTHKRYGMIEDATNEVAQELGIYGKELQAILWVAYRDRLSKKEAA